MYPTQNDLELTGTFSNIEKAAIISLLYKVGEADGNLSDAESIMIAKCNQVLKLNLYNNESNLIDQTFAYSIDELIEIIKPLTKEQHEFIVRSAYDVHNTDAMDIRKTDVFIKICKSLSINAEELPNIINQSNKKPLSYSDTPEAKKREAAGKVLFDYLEHREKASSRSGCLGLLLLVIVITSIIAY